MEKRTTFKNTLGGMLNDANTRSEEEPTKGTPANYTYQKPAPFQSMKTSTINTDMVIVGDVRAENPLNILGCVKGDVNNKESIFVGGSIEGNVRAHNATLDKGYIRGNVTVDKDVSIEDRSLVIGDITCETLNLDGALRGNVEVPGHASFSKNSVLFGNITCGSVSIETGAQIKGFLNIQGNKFEEGDLNGMSAYLKRLDSPAEDTELYAQEEAAPSAEADDEDETPDEDASMADETEADAE